jgi:RimJ/RimL family protein N-acetyltransferase
MILFVWPFFDESEPVESLFVDMGNMDINTIRIEPITLELTSGYRDAVEEVAHERRYLATTRGFPLESTTEFVRSMILGGGVLYVALRNDKVVGWCDIKSVTYEGFEHTGMLGMGVLASVRNQGVGTALLRSAIDAAWQLGLMRIELEVFASNAPAIHLYEKLGFQVEGCKKRARILDSITDDIVCMALLK